MTYIALSVLGLGSAVFCFIQGWYFGSARGYRQGLRAAAQICADSKVDPRKDFAEWLRDAEKL